MRDVDPNRSSDASVATEEPPFESVWWLRGRHVGTIAPALFAPRARVRFERERWDTPDGDFIDVDRIGMTEAARDPVRPILVVFHGLESSTDSRYVRGLMAAADERGWSGIAPHFRGCSGPLNRMPRFYHSGDSDEVDWILRRVVVEHGTTRPLLVAGISLGGNMLLKWLGEHRGAAAEVVRAAAAVSAPIDLTAGGHHLGRGFNRFYTWMFLRTLKKKSREKWRAHPGLFDRDRMEMARTLHAFDDVVTAPLHGFVDADDYWHRASSKPLLRHIAVPTLLLIARNDPFLPEQALARADEVSRHVTLDYPRHGGHVGFVSSGRDRHEWMPRRVVRFLAAQLEREVASQSSRSTVSDRPVAPSPSSEGPGSG